MLTSRRSLFLRPLGAAVAMLAVLAGCASSPEDSPPDPPRTADTLEVTETPVDVPSTMDPAAAARVERVRRSLEQGQDVNKADADGRTALMMAAFEGYTEVVEILLDHGAAIDQGDYADRTALMFASSGPFPQTVELLIERGANVNHVDTAEGWTALMIAAAEGHQPVVELLLGHGADIHLTDQDDDAAIDHARERGQTHIVALLEAWPEGR